MQLSSSLLLVILTTLLIFGPSLKANLLVQYKIDLNCNVSSPAYTGCLRGMTCERSKCVKASFIDESAVLPNIIHSRRDSRISKSKKRQSEPAIEPQVAAVPVALNDAGPVTTDGTCGASNGGTVCGNWDRGSCCSIFGVSLHSHPEIITSALPFRG